MVKIEERKEMIRTQSKIFNRDFEKGYDKSNLTSMRKFSLMFSILHTLYAKLSWSHYRLLIGIRRKHIRDCSIEECIKSNWSVKEIKRQIITCSYSRSLKNNILTTFEDNHLLLSKECYYYGCK